MEVQKHKKNKILGKQKWKTMEKGKCMHSVDEIKRNKNGIGGTNDRTNDDNMRKIHVKFKSIN